MITTRFCSYSDKLDRRTGALNPWTLCFTDRRTEQEYRHHFSADFTLDGRRRSSAQQQRKSRSSQGSAAGAGSVLVETGASSIAKIDETFRVASPKYSVLMGEFLLFEILSLNHRIDDNRSFPNILYSCLNTGWFLFKTGFCVSEVTGSNPNRFNFFSFLVRFFQVSSFITYCMHLIV